MCDVARRGCDVAGDLRQHRVRCRSRAGRHRSWWRGGWPSDVAMSCDVRGGRERRGGVASDIAGAASDVAQVARARERLSDIARASSDIARDIPRGGWRGGDIRKLVFSLCPPPCGRPRLGGRLGDIAQAVSEVARPLRPRERCCDIARAPSDIAQRCWRAMLRCRAMWRGRPSDVLPSPRRPSDIARASSDIATSLPPGAAERRSDIAPLPSDIATSPSSKWTIISRPVPHACE